MNVVTCDESWIHYFEPHQSAAHQKCKKALYCHKDHNDYQYEKGYVCHIFTTKGLAINALIPKGKVLRRKKGWRKLVKFNRVSVVFICHMITPQVTSQKCDLILSDQGDYFLEHPPYSPDIASCNFFLFPRLKKNLAGRKYTSRQKLGAATFDLLRGVPKKDNEKAFKYWIEGLKLCIFVYLWKESTFKVRNKQKCNSIFSCHLTSLVAFLFIRPSYMIENMLWVLRGIA